MQHQPRHNQSARRHRPRLRRQPRPPRGQQLLLSQRGFQRPLRPRPPRLPLPRQPHRSASRALTPPTRTSRAYASSPAATDIVRPGPASAHRTALRCLRRQRPAWLDTRWRERMHRILVFAALLITTDTFRRRLVLLMPTAALSSLAHSFYSVLLISNFKSSSDIVNL